MPQLDVPDHELEAARRRAGALGDRHHERFAALERRERLEQERRHDRERRQPAAGGEQRERARVPVRSARCRRSRSSAATRRRSRSRRRVAARAAARRAAPRTAGRSRRSARRPSTRSSATSSVGAKSASVSSRRSASAIRIAPPRHQPPAVARDQHARPEPSADRARDDDRLEQVGERRDDERSARQAATRNVEPDARPVYEPVVRRQARCSPEVGRSGPCATTTWVVVAR